MSEIEGPTIRTEGSCFACSYCRSERYVWDDEDSGHNVSCAHPLWLWGKPRHIGDTTWRTPEWCPLLRAALLREADRLIGGLTATMELLAAAQQERDELRAENARLREALENTIEAVSSSSIIERAADRVRRIVRRALEES